MTYCTNPECSHPKNPPTAKHCQACGSELLLRSRYRVIGALGRGGFGATFLARDEALPGRPPCVIKQLRPTAEASNFIEMARDLFQREAKILGKIGNHPQLPRLLDYFEAQQEFFLVQEYISGATLQQEVRRGGPFSEAGVKQFLSEILPVMQYIHSHQVIHRDIKPANLIRREQDKRLVLIDFGAVKDKVNPVKASQSDQTVLTAYAIGTPGYAPPEQMAMRPVYASDIYAIGVTCIYLLTGKSPKDLSYDPQTGEMLWQQQVKVSEHFSKVLHKMLEISVRLRYQSAEAILRDLDLEPYLDSLAQNMAFPSGPQSAPLSGPHSPGSNSQDSGALGYADFEDSSASSGSSPSSRMAAAIRARRDRASAKSTTSPHRYRRSFNLSSVSSDSSGKPSASNQTSKKSRQVTAKALCNAYNRGHRDFSLQVLNALDLQRVTLTGASFASAKLKGANLQNADLSNTNFGKADLAQASLRSVDFRGAYLGGANLEGSDLRGADLSRTCLKEANLKGANLCGAILTAATITDGQLATARTNWSTVYPNGKRGLKG
ncbi:MAG: pentapeptide repeat-containing protein [Cyanobacteria bacterium P01_A01_bin.114]